MPESSTAEQPLLSQWFNTFEPEQIFYGILGFFWLVYAWDNYLLYRQYKVFCTVLKPPPELEEHVPADTFEKSRLYQLDKTRFTLVRGLYSQMQFTAVLALQLIPWLWFESGRHLEHFSIESQLLQSLVFVMHSSCISFTLGLPWSYYYSFVIEERHGFNKQTLGFFMKDQLKGLVVGLALGLPITALLLGVITWAGPYFYIYAWLAASLVTFVLICIYPTFIAPLFDRYEPLIDGELKQMIEALAKSVSFPLTKLFVVEGSKRSAHSNAYLYGLWNNKRIVLFDTLIEGYKLDNKAADVNKTANDDEQKQEDTQLQSDSSNSKEEKDAGKSKGCNNEEVVAVLGHELGHWALSHNLYNIMISEANLFLMFFAFGQMMHSDSVFAAFGFEPPAPLLLRLMFIFEFVFSPYNEVLSLAMTLLTRTFEFQADRYAVQLGHAAKLKSALVKLHTDNLSFPVYDWLYSAITHSHPPLLQRMRAIDEAFRKSQ